jgi:YVTN family beta-propeller protein
MLGCTAPRIQQQQQQQVVERFSIGGEGGWDFLTFDPVGNRLFISRGDYVQVWSPRSNRVVGEIADTPGVHGIALAPELLRGFTSNGRSNTVSVFQLDDLHTIATISVTGQNPDAILYDSSVKRVFTFNGRSHNATVIDAESLKVVATIALGGKPEVAVTDGKGHVFVNLEDTSEVAVIDEATNRVMATWPLSPCEEPTGLAIDAAHDRLFSVCANRRMVVIDATTGRLVATVPIGERPDGAAFDPASGRAFSANGEGSLTVIQEADADHFHVVATTLTQPGARTLALDPESHLIYLVSASFGPTPAATTDQPRPRAPMLPGTFTVLVVNPS